MDAMKFYIIHNGKRVYFSFDQTGFKEAKAYCVKHKLGKKKFFIAKERESYSDAKYSDNVKYL